MKTLYIDCGMGAAGDMLTAALLELLSDPEDFVRQLNGMGLPDVVFTPEKCIKCGIVGTHMSVTIRGVQEGEALHAHGDHGHHHAHGHHHSNLHVIEHVFSHLALPEQVKQDALAVYRLIAEAESAVHGVPVTQVHFHEVGALDAIADVAAVCLLMHTLAPEQITASAVHVGSGTVSCAHGRLPVPAPAAAYILKGVPIYGGSIRGELCTPTGAALLKHFVTKFGDMPVMRVSGIGYGMGRKDFEQANCVRVFLGETV